MDKSTQESNRTQTVYNHETHWLGLALGLGFGLAIDALSGFKTGTFFTFVGIVLGMSGLLDFKKK